MAGVKIMKKMLWNLVLAVLGLGAVGSQAAPIVLNTGFGGSASFTLPGVAVGSSLSFEYQLSNVVYTGGPWIGINSSFVNPCCGAQFNDWQAANTGWLTAAISTAGTISPNDLVFTANTFGAAGNSATLTIRNVAIDRQIVAAQVPEPATLALLGMGLLGLAAARRRK